MKRTTDIQEALLAHQLGFKAGIHTPWAEYDSSQEARVFYNDSSDIFAQVGNTQVLSNLKKEHSNVISGNYAYSNVFDLWIANGGASLDKEDTQNLVEHSYLNGFEGLGRRLWNYAFKKEKVGFLGRYSAFNCGITWWDTCFWNQSVANEAAAKLGTISDYSIAASVRNTLNPTHSAKSTFLIAELDCFLTLMTRRHQIRMLMDSDYKATVRENCKSEDGTKSVSEADYLKHLQRLWGTAYTLGLYNAKEYSIIGFAPKVQNRDGTLNCAIYFADYSYYDRNGDSVEVTAAQQADTFASHAKNGDFPYNDNAEKICENANQDKLKAHNDPTDNDSQKYVLLNSINIGKLKNSINIGKLKDSLQDQTQILDNALQHQQNNNTSLLFQLDMTAYKIWQYLPTTLIYTCLCNFFNTAKEKCVQLTEAATDAIAQRQNIQQDTSGSYRGGFGD